MKNKPMTEKSTHMENRVKRAAGGVIAATATVANGLGRANRTRRGCQ